MDRLCAFMTFVALPLFGQEDWEVAKKRLLDDMQPGYSFFGAPTFNPHLDDDVRGFISDYEDWQMAEYQHLHATGVSSRGVEVDGKMLRIKGRYRPDLIPLTYAVRNVASNLTKFPESSDIFEKHLRDRGMSSEDLRRFAAAVTGDNDPELVIDANPPEYPTDFAFVIEPGARLPNKKEFQTLVSQMRCLIREQNRDWAISVLEALSPQGRRVLLSYIDEHFMDGLSHNIEIGAQTEEDFQGSLKYFLHVRDFIRIEREMP